MTKLPLLCAVLLLIVSCTNSQTETTVEQRDSMLKKDNTIKSELNTVTPPASIGRY